jgi:hypothetical protein
MSEQLYLLIGLVIMVILFYYYSDNQNINNNQNSNNNQIETFETNQIETFETDCNPDSILSRSIQEQFKDTKNLACLLDTSKQCQLNKDTNIFDQKNLYPQNILRTPDGEYLAVFNDGRLYINDDIEQENLWRGPLEHSSPKDDVNLLMVTFDRNGILLGVGTDHSIYIKQKSDLQSPWKITPLPNSGCVIYIIFDKDNKLLGLDLDGNIIKKETENIGSKWEKAKSDNKLPLLKLYWDINDHMMGISTDFKLYQKSLVDWETSMWKTVTPPEQLLDILYASDGRLYGVVIDKQNDIIELRKQNQGYYSSPFYPLVDSRVEGVSVMMLGQIIRTKMGSDFMLPYEKAGDENNNSIEDPSLNEVQQQYILDDQTRLRKLCVRKKKIYKDSDYHDFELQRQIEEQDTVIQNLGKELDKYTQIDKKYLNIQDDNGKITNITQLADDNN